MMFNCEIHCPCQWAEVKQRSSGENLQIKIISHRSKGLESIKRPKKTPQKQTSKMTNLITNLPCVFKALSRFSFFFKA